MEKSQVSRERRVRRGICDGKRGIFSRLAMQTDEAFRIRLL
jgi:hypothetical protein